MEYILLKSYARKRQKDKNLRNYVQFISKHYIFNYFFLKYACALVSAILHAITDKSKD